MSTKALHTCMLCEAICGLSVEIEGDRATRIEGDREDPFSRGHICPKAAALEDIRLDPDRVTRPLRRTKGGDFAPVSWDEALDECAERLADIQTAHGRDAVAMYFGNPTAHNYSGVLYSIFLYEVLGTRSRFSATSADQLPHMLASLEMFGNQALLPMPDLDRTDFFLILGGNPAVSNGSLMSAGNPVGRIKAIRERGGRVVVVDPRFTETARLADAHHFIRPGTDALLLLAMIRTIFAENLARPGRLEAFTDGLAELRDAAEPFTPEAVAGVTGISATDIRALARDFAGASRAACYGRVGICTQEFGGASAWLVNALDVVTGNLDREGGMMFATPAVDLAKLATLIGQKGSFARYRSRVRGLPEFGGELPVATLAEEIETPGKEQIRGLVTIAGNPVLSAPNGARLDRALPGLDFMVSLDIYKNETTRHATFILPSSFGLERNHYDLLLYALAVRNAARYVPPLFAPAGEARHDWEISIDLAARLAKRTARHPAASVSERMRAAGLFATSKALRALGPRGTLDLLLRTGPYRLSLRALERDTPHGKDLGAHVSRLPAALHTQGKRLRLAPPVFLADLPRLRARLAAGASGGTTNGHLSLIGRRQLRSNNSWMHNSHRLVKGKDRCTLLVHPDDAGARGLRTGDRATVKSAAGAVDVPVEVTKEIAPGVVSLPHGWGHHRGGADMRIARDHAGVSLNDLTDESRVDALSATASFSGVPVEVTKAQ